MSIFQLLLVGGGLMLLMVVGYVAMSGKSPAKESQRRLQGIRYRHSESTNDKVESQLKKAIAARKPKFHKVAGSGSRAEALAVRLERTGAVVSLEVSDRGLSVLPLAQLVTTSQVPDVRPAQR